MGRVSGKAWMGSMWGESGLQTQQPGSGRLREVEVHWQGQVGSGESHAKGFLALFGRQ